MPLQVLFLCTGNSARSVLSEAALNHSGRPRFAAYSGGSKPAGAVHPQTLAQLKAAGIATEGLNSKNCELFSRAGAPQFDAVITLCDSAQLDPCPVFFGDFVLAHWGMPDPAAVVGPEEIQRAAFADALRLISRRIDLMLALPIETLQHLALEARVRAIGQDGAEAVASGGRAGG